MVLWLIKQIDFNTNTLNLCSIPESKPSSGARAAEVETKGEKEGGKGARTKLICVHKTNIHAFKKTQEWGG